MEIKHIASANLHLTYYFAVTLVFLIFAQFKHAALIKRRNPLELLYNKMQLKIDAPAHKYDGRGSQAESAFHIFAVAALRLYGAVHRAGTYNL